MLTKESFHIPPALSSLKETGITAQGKEAQVKKVLLGEKPLAIKKYFPTQQTAHALGEELLRDISEFAALGSDAIPQTSLLVTDSPETERPTLYAIQDWISQGLIKDRSISEILQNEHLRLSLGKLLLQVTEYYYLYGKMPDAIGASGTRIFGFRIPSIKNLFPFFSENIAIDDSGKAVFIDPHTKREFSGIGYKMRTHIQAVSYQIFARILLRNQEKKEVINQTEQELKVKTFLASIPEGVHGPTQEELRDPEKIGHGRKVLVVTESYGGVHGVSVSVQNFLRYLQLNGFKATLLTAGRENSVKRTDQFGVIRTVKGVSSPGGDRELSVAIKQINQLVRKGNYSGIVVINPAVLGLQVLSLPGIKKVPTLATDETRIGMYLRYEFPRGFGRLAQKAYERTSIQIKQRIARRVKTIVTPSDSYKMALQKKGLRKVVSVLKPGNLSESQANITPSEELKKEIAPNGEKILLFVGKVSRVKNLHFLSRVTAMLDKSNFSYKLVIVGDNKDTSEVEKLRSKFNLDNTIFVGNQKGDRLAQMYAVADLFLNPSVSETLGLTTLEALKTGLPVIGADSIGTKDLIQDKKTGLLLSVEKPGDAEVWAQKIMKILKDEEQLMLLSDNAKQQETTTWREHFRVLLAKIDL